LAYRGEIELEVKLDGDPLLVNPYAVIAVSPEMHSHVKHGAAQRLIAFLVSDAGQRLIDGYRVEGAQLFIAEA
ncbi:MAG: hypothetical protein ACLFUX_07920, partial [Spirochaetaceae bacterium]